MWKILKLKFLYTFVLSTSLTCQFYLGKNESNLDVKLNLCRLFFTTNVINFLLLLNVLLCGMCIIFIVNLFIQVNISWRMIYPLLFQSIRAYHAQGLSNDPRCKSLENLVKEFTLRQTSSVAIQRGILSQTPQMSYNQQSPYSQGNRLNGGRDSHAVLNNFLVQGAANELRQRSQAQGQGFVNTSNLVHEQRQMNLFPTSSSQFQQQPNYQQQGNMRGEPLYQNNNFNQKPSYVMGGQPNNVFLSSQNTDQRRSNNNVNAGHGPGTASSNFSSQYSTFSRQNPGNLQNAGNVQVVQQSAHHPLAGYSTSHGVTGAPQHPYKSSGTQNQQVMVGNQAGVVGNQSSMRNMGLKWNGSG